MLPLLLSPPGLPHNDKMCGRYKSIVYSRKIFATILIAVFMISCNPGPDRLPGGNESSPGLAISTPFHFSPAQILPTISYTPFTTQTIMPPGMVFPTPLANFVNKDFRQRLAGSSDCLLPCWGGMTPGKTGWADSLSQVSRFLQSTDIPHTPPADLVNARSYIGTIN
jgi:hypothetical protein